MDGPHTQDTKGECPIWPVTYPPCLALVFDSLFGIHFCRLYVVHCCFYIIFYPVYHFPLHKKTKQACTSLSPPSAQTVKTGMYQSIIYPSTNSQNRNVPIYHLQHSQNRNVPVYHLPQHSQNRNVPVYHLPCTVKTGMYQCTIYPCTGMYQCTIYPNTCKHTQVEPFSLWFFSVIYIYDALYIFVSNYYSLVT